MLKERRELDKINVIFEGKQSTYFECSEMEAWEVLGLWLSVGIFFSGFSSVYQITLKVWLGLRKPIISRLQLLVSGERKKLPLARVSTFRSILMKQDTVLECNTDQLARFTRLRSYHEWIKWFTFPPREVHILQSSYDLLLGNAWSNLATNRTPGVPTLHTVLARLKVYSLL